MSTVAPYSEVILIGKNFDIIWASYPTNCYIELAMRKYRVRKVQATFAQALTLALVDRHGKCWPDGELQSLKLEW